MSDYPPIKVERSNWRVEVDPEVPWWTNKTGEALEDELREICEEIAVSIRRHVDSIGAATVLSDVRKVCVYCNRAWEDPPYCCGKAQDAAAAHGIEYEEE